MRRASNRPLEDVTIDRPERSSAWEADLALARRAAAGDRDALHRVVDRYARPLFRIARGLCDSVPDAEDAVQEALIDILRGIGGFDGNASLLTWMTRILVRRAGKMRRKRKRSAALPLDESSDSVGWSERGQTSRNADREDCRLDLHAALPKLAREFREVIVLREVQGMSYAEIAAALGIPQGTVESRIHRARLELRVHLRSYRSEEK